MPTIDISFDAEEWMLEPITGEEDAHILTLASGPVAVELYLTGDDLLTVADAIEDAIDRIENVPLDWEPVQSAAGSFHVRFRLSFAGVQASAPYWAHDTPIGYWTLVFDDEDNSQACLSVRHDDIGSLLYKVRLITMKNVDDTLSPDLEDIDIYRATAHQDRLDAATARRFLHLVAEARRNARDAEPPLARLVDILKRMD